MPRQRPTSPTTSPTTRLAGRRCGSTTASRSTARSTRRTGTTPGQLLLSAVRSRQPDLQHQRPGLPGEGYGAADRREPWRGLSVNGAAAWNSGELKNSPALIGNLSGSTSFGKPITGILHAGQDHQAVGQGDRWPMCTATRAARSPTPRRSRGTCACATTAEWGTYHAVSPSWGCSITSHSLSASGNVEAYDQPAWTTFDLSAGVAKDNWTVSLIRQNITNVNKSTFTTSRQFILTRRLPMRPRIRSSVKFGYKPSPEHHLTAGTASRAGLR